jgi:hypothetical protein
MDINWLSVIIAGIAGIVIGAVWFGPKTFFPIWWKALGRSPQEQPGTSNMGIVFGSTFAGAFVQAIVMAVVISLVHSSNPEMTWFDGLATGALMSIGFNAATTLGHKLFGGFSIKTWILEIGQDTVSLAVMGAIIAAMH